MKSNRDYDAGVKLFAAFSDDGGRLEYFEQGETELRRELLIEDLQELAEKHTPNPSQEGSTPKELISESDFKRAPANILEMIARVKLIYKENAFRKYNLEKLPTKLERGIMANTIIDFDEEADELLFRIDYWKEYGRLPEHDPLYQEVSEMDLPDLMKALARCRQFISKQKKNAARNEEVDEMIKRRDAIERRISELD